MQTPKMLVLSVAALTVLAGCGSPATTVSSSASSTVQPAVLPGSVSSAMSSSAQAVAAGTTAFATGTATTMGQEMVTLDAQSAAWLKTFCSNLAGIVDLQQLAGTGRPTEAGQAIRKLVNQVSEARRQMGQQPPPTFQDGQSLHITALITFRDFDAGFSNVDLRLATIDFDSEDASRQITLEFGPQIGALVDKLNSIQPDVAVKAAAAAQVEECAMWQEIPDSASGSTTSSAGG